MAIIILAILGMIIAGPVGAIVGAILGLAMSGKKQYGTVSKFPSNIFSSVLTHTFCSNGTCVFSNTRRCVQNGI